MILLGRLGKPAIGFPHKADVREIILSGIKGDDLKFQLACLSEAARQAEAGQTKNDELFWRLQWIPARLVKRTAGIL